MLERGGGRIRRGTLVLSVAAFAVVGLLTVRLGIRANLRSYQIASERQRALRLREQGEIGRLRLSRTCAPERVYDWTWLLRRNRDQLEGVESRADF